jgi:DNA-binding transcriptional ArsR family regulator
MIMNFDDATIDTVLTALANPKRRGIIYILSLYPTSISYLAASQSLSLPAIHKHLRILEDADLISRKKIGRTTIIALNPSQLLIAKNWFSQFTPEWGSVEASLENYVSRLEE